MKLWVVARRDLLAYLRSPISYLVATLFLAVKGTAFWLFVALLDQQGAPASWPLRYFFGGSFLFYLFLLLIAAVITMRLVAEERRLGTIEPLLTAPVSPLEIIVGKYLAALVFYVLLWAPTFVYIVVLGRFAPTGTLEVGPIAGGYLGTLLIGASALAIGLLASTVTQHQLLAVVLAFVALLLLLLAGAAADTAAPGGTARAVLERLSLQHQMEDFGRGLVDTRVLAYHAGLTLLALWAAVRLLHGGTGGARRRAALELAALVAVVLLGNVLAGRHYRRLDWTSAHANTLAPRTEEILSRLSPEAPVTAHVLMLPSGNGDLYLRVRDLLALYTAHASPRGLHVEYVDLDREPERLRQLAQQYSIDGEELRTGAILFVRGERARYVGADELAEIEPDPTGDAPARLKAFKAEEAFDAAILALLDPRPPLVCFTRGHGEARVDSLTADGMSSWGGALRRANQGLRTLDSLEPGVPLECDVTVVAGPDHPFAAGEVAALEALLGRGGRLLVLLGARVDGQRVGLEPLLERWGVVVGGSVVLDAGVQMSTSALAFAVDQGYAEHGATHGLQRKRTVWAEARPVRAKADSGAVEIVHTTDAGWGETDLGALVAGGSAAGRAELRYDAGRDEKGPLPIAVAVEKGGTRLVVLGSRAIARNDHDVFFNRDLLEANVSWLVGRQEPLGIAPQLPARLKLALDEGQLSRVFWICVVALPLCCILLGGAVWWRRRR